MKNLKNCAVVTGVTTIDGLGFAITEMFLQAGIPVMTIGRSETGFAVAEHLNEQYFAQNKIFAM